MGHGLSLALLFLVVTGETKLTSLLERRSGNADNPRILNTFNEPIDDWLSFFMFTTFTDRDGKFQLLALAESSFDPLARTTRFMLTEEAHHLFVGQSGVQRVVKRTCELMKKHDTDEVKKHGGIPLKILQKYINFWYSSSIDLFGSENSSNAANYFAAGLKGRAYEQKLFTDHQAINQKIPNRSNRKRPSQSKTDLPALSHERDPARCLFARCPKKLWTSGIKS